jgi:hypothetical protein
MKNIFQLKTKESFYTPSQVAIASLIGGPWAGTWLMRRNYQALNGENKKLTSMIFLIAFYLIAFLLMLIAATSLIFFLSTQPHHPYMVYSYITFTHTDIRHTFLFTSKIQAAEIMDNFGFDSNSIRISINRPTLFFWRSRLSYLVSSFQSNLCRTFLFLSKKSATKTDRSNRRKYE